MIHHTIWSGEGNGNHTPVFLPKESHGQRSLVGYSPWGHKESGTNSVTNTYNAKPNSKYLE